MLFKRRRELGFIEKLKRVFWPAIGWRRSFSYYLHRLKRLPGSASSIATGFAIGVAVSFTPFIGFHIILALMLTWAVRGSLMAAVPGTFIGNPWTFPLMWFLSFKVGALLLGLPESEAIPENISVQYVQDIFDFMIFGDRYSELVPFPISWDYVHEVLILVMVPWLLGSLVCGLGAFFACFYPIRRLIRTYRRQRHLRQRKGRHRFRMKLKRMRENHLKRKAEKAERKAELIAEEESLNAGNIL